VIEMVIPRPVRKDDVGVPLPDQVCHLLAGLEIRHQLAVVDVQDVRRDPELLVTGLDFSLAPLGERTAGLCKMPDVAVRERDELHLVPLRGEERRRPPELLLRIVRVGAEGDDPELTGRGRLGGERLDAEDREEEERVTDGLTVNQ